MSSLPFKLVSADSHIVEPPTLWTDRMEPRFRDRAPRIERGEKGDEFVCEGIAIPRKGIGLMAIGGIEKQPRTILPDARQHFVDRACRGRQSGQVPELRAHLIARGCLKERLLMGYACPIEQPAPLIDERFVTNVVGGLDVFFQRGMETINGLLDCSRHLSNASSFDHLREVELFIQ